MVEETGFWWGVALDVFRGPRRAMTVYSLVPCARKSAWFQDERLIHW